VKYDCLIVDDETALSESTCEYFNMFGVHTAWVANAENCLRFFHSNTADLVLLDINMDGMSGFDLCKRLRADTDVPILFISARQSNDDMLLALSIGGDDYIQKPYSLSVLLAKVKVVLARYRAAAPEEECGLALDPAGRFAVLRGNKIELKPLEYKLLAYLVANTGRVVDKRELFREVWGDSIAAENTLNVHIRRLREKLEADPNNPDFIKTVWGTGYVFENGQG